jgi:OOP family OmpA-OmpF porin
MKQRTSYVLAAFLSAAVSTQVNADPLGYVSDSSGQIVRDSSGDCVHTGSWTTANAVVPGCDGFVAKKMAPKVVAAPAPAPAPVVVPAPAPVVVPPPAPVVKAAPKMVAKTIALDGANFANASAKLSKSADAQLDEVVDTAKKNPDIKLSVTGYTDNRGKKASNEKLSAHRAESVKAYLVKHGVAADRISTAGHGETDQFGDNKTAAGRAANRRVELNYTIEEVAK